MMKFSSKLLQTGLLVAGLAVLPSAQAALLFDFSVGLTSGPNQGTLNGTLDLGFVSAGGSGTGAASNLTITSLPASFGALGGGNVVTAWAHQVTNSFTVTNGAISAFAFFAATGGTTADDAFALNSTSGNIGSFGTWSVPGNLNELTVTDSVFGYNFGGLSGVSFTPRVQGVPEPATMGLVVAAALAGLASRRRTAQQPALPA